MKIYFVKTVLFVMALIPISFSYGNTNCPSNYQATLNCPDFNFYYPEEISGSNYSSCANGVLVAIKDDEGQAYNNNNGTWTVQYGNVNNYQDKCTLYPGKTKSTIKK